MAPNAFDTPIEYDNGKTLMAQGPQALHGHVASRMEKALGKKLPQMEVRFRDVSISADIMVKDKTDVKVELPTLVNVVKTGFREMRSSTHVVKKQVLKNVSGVFKPGTITLVLGQPGSGKSSLMKLLSGRFPNDKNITIEGQVTYNGTPANEMRKQLPQFVSYVTQRDRHYSLLTVKETLEFAHACSGGGLSKRDEQHFTNGTPEENLAALEAARAMFKHYPDIVIQQLGLDNCQNTIVGDAMTRGVSGGERKRVTTGEMEFGNKYVMMMDEISTGLDSAATFDIITTQRSIAKKFRKTVVISLVQPSPEVFELFDDVVILNEGHVMYHGPRAEALGYFESLGFKCPPRRDVADFLLDLGTDKQAQYEEQIPDYLIWVYWINPIAWCVRALAVNQYSDSAFDKCVYGDVNFCESFNQTVGDYSLSTFEVPSEKYWLWYGIVFMAAAYIFFMFLSYLALEYHRYESPENVTLDSDSKNHGSDEYGLMKTPRRSPTDDDTVVSVLPAREKHFVPVTVAFKDLWYTVPDPTNPNDTIDLLKGISGYALPGTITALMGSSGAGKTTLMDVIAGRKTGGKITGQILLNGHPATDLVIRRSTGYCEQMDIHSESATIREALTFSAFLRQGADVPDSSKYDSVNECLDLLDLHPIADQIIRGSSVEQMKRLTIGVELAAQPSVFLLLLKRGGETVFTGELGKNASEMIAYFESIDGVDKLEDNYNPATWMLEVIGAGVGNSNGDKTDFVKVFQGSKHYQLLQDNLDRDGVTRPSPDLPELTYGDKRAATEMTQAKFLMQRFFNMYWRTASFNLTRFFVSLVLGLVFGITYAGAEYTSYSGINSGMGMMFLAVGFLGIGSFNSALPVASEERAAFYRERAAQTYNAFWYFLASSVVEIPYAFLASLLFMATFYPMVGFTGFGAFLTLWLTVSLHVLLQAYIGEFLVFLLPTVEVAQILGMLLALIFLLFMGSSPPAGDLPTGYKWLYHLTPQHYTLAAICAIVFGDCSSDGGSDVGCQVMTNVPPSLPSDMTVKEYLDDVFLMKHSQIWRNAAVVLAFLVAFRVFTLLAMRFVNHQKR
eukprot:jgi/Phyca11/511179/fgenesh2_kg.PHYCAscaffold_78_\